jgi:RNA polymerase sigma-70 factor (ECF subfamily)
MPDGVTKANSLSDREHFEAVVRRYQGPLLRYVSGRMGRDQAQDVVQDVFLRLHKTMQKDGLRDVTSVGTWLFRVAHNRMADLLRRQGLDRKAKQKLADDGGGPDSPWSGLDEVVRREDCRAALELLDKLPTRQREVILLKVSEGMTYREIGDVTGQALGTVGYLMNQGLGTLARELKSAGVI